ncbi:MAG: hypothetical protein WCK58_14515, partial [Chloroflexota bacterium]
SGPSPSTSPTGPASPPASPTGSVPATPAPSAAVVCDDTVTGGPAATMDPAGADATTYDEIEHQVEELRALNATAPVARGVFDQAGLCAYLRTSFATDNPDALVAATETLYKRMLLLPATASLKDLYLALLTSQVAGLYDNKTRTMYVVSSSGNLGPTEEITYAHEFTHALQDQHFDLKKLMGDATDQSDRSMARSTLVEGDATLLMSLWAQAHLTPAELGQIAGSVDPASTALLESMPAILKDPLLFPYTSGLNVAMGAFTTGGFGGVDAMFSAPPESTEQVMHPEKLASREAPVIVSFPSDLATRLGAGWKVSMQDTFGELLLGIILREGGATAPEDAAAGWGGDRVALLEGSGGKVAVVMDASWDTAADADQYAAALEPMVARLTAAGQSAAVLRPSEKRVVLVSAESADTMGRVANVLGLAG